MARPEEVEQGWMRGRLFRVKRPGCVLRKWNGHGANPEFTEIPVTPDMVLKCVMVSRLGDCGLTDDLTAENGYHLRLYPDDLDPVPSSEESSRGGE